MEQWSSGTIGSVVIQNRPILSNTPTLRYSNFELNLSNLKKLTFHRLN